MQTLVYDERTKKLLLSERPKPKPSAANAILKVSVSAICGTDIRTFKHGSSRITDGRIVGHEVTGILEEVGENIAGFKPGERVIVTPAIGCGKWKTYWSSNWSPHHCCNEQWFGYAQC
jgi:L-iditol 2-dehydrogenase